MAPAKKMALEVIKSRNLKIPEPATCVRVQIIDRSDGRVVHKLYEISIRGDLGQRRLHGGALRIGRDRGRLRGLTRRARFDVFQFGINDNAFVSKLREARQVTRRKVARGAKGDNMRSAKGDNVRSAKGDVRSAKGERGARKHARKARERREQASTYVYGAEPGHYRVCSVLPSHSV